jgi:DNA-binding Lrp family transcriptional regulator
MTENPYKLLAERLDALPHGYPPTEDGVELRLLEMMFTPEEASLAAKLRVTLENFREIAERIGAEPRDLRNQLKTMARKRLITTGRAASGRGLGYGLMPFAVGIYEMHHDRIDREYAERFEAYFQQGLGEMLSIQPPVHRVIPVGESVPIDLEVRPYESAATIVEQGAAWGVADCLCRKQKALIGDPCDHPLDVCMYINQVPNAFDHDPAIKAVSKDEALATLKRAAESGLVHSVSNSQIGGLHPILGGEEQLWYI